MGAFAAGVAAWSAAVLGALPVWGTTLPTAPTDEQLVARAAFVVAGAVIRTQGTWTDDGTQIVTLIDLRVADVLKGAIDHETIQLRVLGGEANGVGMLVPDAPTFSPGDEVVLFLEPNPQTLTPLVGFNAGKVPITPDVTTGRRMAPSRGVTRDDYLNRLRSLVQAQGAAGAGIPGGTSVQPKEGQP